MTDKKPKRKRIGLIVALSLVAVLFVYLVVQFFLCRSALKNAAVRLEGYDARTITLNDGNMTYVDEGSGEVILVAHGISGGYDQAFDTLKERTGDYRVIAPSRFGYLGSTMPENATPAGQAKAYAELLDVLGIDKVYILGTSAGGTVAIRFALDYPERTKGLILYSSAAPYVEKPESYTEYQGPPEFLCNDYAMWLMSPLFEPLMGMESNTIYEMLPVDERRDGMVMDASITNPDMARYFDDYPIETLAVPSLVLHAKDDKLASYDAMASAVPRFPNCTFVPFENGGHMMAGHGAEVNAALDGFARNQ